MVTGAMISMYVVGAGGMVLALERIAKFGARLRSHLPLAAGFWLATLPLGWAVCGDGAAGVVLSLAPTLVVGAGVSLLIRILLTAFDLLDADALR
jgi:hypothetical protein